MKNKFSIYISAGLLLAASLFMPSCTREFTDPATTTEEQLAKNSEGLLNICSGIQRRYSFGRQSPVYTTMTASGLSGLELRVLNAGNTDELNLSIGKTSVDGSNAIIRQLWDQSFLVMKECNFVLKNSSVIGDPAVRSSAEAWARMFKAMSLGNLAMFFEKSPKDVAIAATFVSRTEVLTEAISQLDAAIKLVEATPVSAVFRGKVVGGIDLQNTLYALAARYYNMLGNNDQAIASAAKASLTAKSFFNYDAVSPNPLFFTSFSNVNVCQPRTITFGLPTALLPEADDKRAAFYIRNAGTAAAPDARYIAPFAFTATPLQPQFPVYVPGEMTLIKAEALARKDLLADAVIEINKIRKKTTDVWGIGAGLTTDFASTDKAAILTEIYRQRCIELFLSGMKLEDARRFGRPDPNNAAPERNRNFYPYPFSERDNNSSNTPPDPAI